MEEEEEDDELGRFVAEEVGDNKEEGQFEDEQDEGQPAKPITQPRLPTKRQIDEHDLTHIPYRAWCVHCRRARGIAMAHRKQDEEKEDKEAAMTTWAMDYTFLTEDFEFLTKAEFEKYAHKEKVKDIVLVCDDRRSGGVKAHLVEHKGLLDTWISGRVAEDLAEFGYRGVGVCIKSDQEPAILEVQRKVAEIRCGAKTVPVNSPAGDSKSNGRVENAIRRVQAMIRTLRSSLEAKLGVKVGKGHALYPWLIEWAADLLTRYKVNSEGRTAVEEIRGKKSARSIAQFGEK